MEDFKKYLKKGDRVLDWGCGHGRLIKLFDGLEISYYGVDQSVGLLKIAKKMFQQEISEGKVHFFSTERRQKNFPPGFFDTVFMIASFHHLPDVTTRQDLLAKITRELKSKGWLICLVWNLESDWSKKKMEKDWKKIGSHDFLIPWKNPAGVVEATRYYHSFKQDELQELLQTAGFVIQKMDYVDQKLAISDAKNGLNILAIAQKK